MPAAFDVQFPVEVCRIVISTGGPEVAAADIVGKAFKSDVEARLRQRLFQTKLEAVPEEGSGASGGAFYSAEVVVCSVTCFMYSIKLGKWHLTKDETGSVPRR